MYDSHMYNKNTDEEYCNFANQIHVNVKTHMEAKIENLFCIM